MIEKNLKEKKIGARVTLEQKKLIKQRAKDVGMKESEYVLYRCFKNEEIPSYYISEGVHNNRIEIRVTDSEKKIIFDKAQKARIKDVSKYIRNCCLDKEIIVIEDLKNFSKELNKIGTNINQLTMLCHQGLIDIPDIKETKESLQNIYQELIKLNNLRKLGR